MEEFNEKLKRIEWLDITKGLGIFLVVIGHTGIPNVLSAWIWSFHMPFFFLVSGMLFNYLKYSTLFAFIKKRLITLILPYIIFSIIVYIWAKVLNYDLFKLRFNELYYGWNGLALWFIPVLFTTEICFYVVKKYCKKVLYIVFAICLFAVLGYFCYLNNFHLIFKLEVFLTSILFYGVGNLFYKYVIHFFEHTKISILIIEFPILLVLSFYLAVYNIPRLDMASNTIGHFFYTYMAAFIGISLIFLLSFAISKSKNNFVINIGQLFSYLGKNTFVILAFHQIVLMNLKMIFERFSIPFYLNSGIRHLLMWSILFLLILSINSYCPWVLGKKK